MISFFDIFKNVLIYGVDNSSLVHNDNRKKDILFVDEGPAASLDDATKIVEAKHFNNLPGQRNNFFMSALQRKWKHFYVHCLQICQFKSKS